MSWYNSGQNSAAVDLVNGLLSSGIGLQPEDVGVITPYKDNMRRIEDLLQSHASEGCHAVAVNTPDSFQGCEAKVIVLVLVVTEDTGPVFADAHRLCVGITHHSDMLSANLIAQPGYQPNAIFSESTS